MIELLAISVVTFLIGYLIGYITNRVSLHGIDFDKAEDIDIHPTYMTFTINGKKYTYMGEGFHWVESSGRKCNKSLAYELDKIWLKGIINKNGKSGKDTK